VKVLKLIDLIRPEFDLNSDFDEFVSFVQFILSQVCIKLWNIERFL
jgi:hypothetical protein